MIRHRNIGAEDTTHAMDKCFSHCFLFRSSFRSIGHGDSSQLVMDNQVPIVNWLNVNPARGNRKRDRHPIISKSAQDQAVRSISKHRGRRGDREAQSDACNSEAAFGTVMTRSSFTLAICCQYNQPGPRRTRLISETARPAAPCETFCYPTLSADRTRVLSEFLPKQVDQSSSNGNPCNQADWG